MVNVYPDSVAGVALGTLAARTALIITNGYAGSAMQMKTLLKNFRIRAAVANMTSGEGPLIIGAAYGELAAASIKAALEDAFAPETGSTPAPQQQAESRRVLWETLGVIQRVSATAFNMDSYDSGKRTLGGGKGLPFNENVGWLIFVYNMSNAPLTTAATISVHQEAWGVSL